MTAVDTLIEKMGTAVVAAVEAQTDAFRRVANDSGIFRRIADLDAAVAAYDEAQDLLRQALEEERIVAETVDQATSAAEWDIAGRIVVEGSKRFILTGVRTDDGDEVRRQVTAEEAKQWVAGEAGRQPEVELAARQLVQAKHVTAGRRDQLALADKRIGASKAQLAAATAVLQALTHTIQGA